MRYLTVNLLLNFNVIAQIIINIFYFNLYTKKKILLPYMYIFFFLERRFQLILTADYLIEIAAVWVVSLSGRYALLKMIYAK